MVWKQQSKQQTTQAELVHSLMCEFYRHEPSSLIHLIKLKTKYSTYIAFSAFLALKHKTKTRMCHDQCSEFKIIEIMHNKFCCSKDVNNSAVEDKKRQLRINIPFLQRILCVPRTLKHQKSTKIWSNVRHTLAWRRPPLVCKSTPLVMRSALAPRNPRAQ